MQRLPQWTAAQWMTVAEQLELSGVQCTGVAENKYRILLMREKKKEKRAKWDGEYFSINI